MTMLGGGFLRILPIIATSAGVILGGAFAISAVTNSVVRYSNSKKMEKYGKTCRSCNGRGFYACKLCKANGTIRWTSMYDPVYINPCLCPTCDGLKVQHCLNCLGRGTVCNI